MPPLTATITFQENGEWTNVHENVSQRFERLYHIEAPDASDSTFILEAMRSCATAMQRILGDAVTAGKRLRCLGGGWSLSNAAITDGWLISTKAMNYYWKMKQTQVHAGYSKDRKGLYFAQCGLSVQELNNFAEEEGWSLTTSGASNGQTIAGAIATGTHGSAFQFGAMPEYVVGFYLITAPDKVIWLERSSYPVVSDSFAAELGVEIKRDDDDLFNAVLVSFGSMGIVAGVMLEAEPKYLFEAQRKHLSFNDAVRNAMNTMTLANVDIPNQGEKPWHFEITFNPHNIQGHCYVTTLFKRPFKNDYTPPKKKAGALGPGESFLHVVGEITNMLPTAGIAFIMNKLMESNLAEEGPQLGTTGETFGTTFLKGKGMSMEMGIDMKDATRVLDLMLGLHPEVDNYAGVISYRWVKQTTAMLGWTKFPVTATIEFNAVHNDRTVAFYNRIWNALEANNIPYTLHWGQMHNFTPARIRKMYGNAVDKWIACREALLSPQLRAVLMSPFLESTGLGAPSAVPPPIV